MSGYVVVIQHAAAAAAAAAGQDDDDYYDDNGDRFVKRKCKGTNTDTHIHYRLRASSGISISEGFITTWYGCIYKEGFA